MGTWVLPGCHAAPSAKAPTVETQKGTSTATQPQVVEYFETGQNQVTVPNALNLFAQLLGGQLGNAQAISDGSQPSSSLSRRTHVWLGVQLAEPKEDEPGVLVTGVVANSPAAKVGIRAQDRIILVDGDSVAAPAELIAIVQPRPEGSHAVVSVARDNKIIPFDVTLELVASPSQLLRDQLVGKPAPAWVGVMPPPGQVAPTVEQYRGKPLLLTFWGPECPLCPQVLATANQWHTQYSKKLNVVGIAPIPTGTLQAEVKRLGIRYTNLSDLVGLISLAYGAFKAPQLVLIDANGVIRDLCVGSSAVDISNVQKTLESMLGD